MLQRDSQHSQQCWFLPIPKSFAPSPPKFPLGLFVRLPHSYQDTPQVTYYGKIIGVCWIGEYGEWSYSIEAPEFHRGFFDLYLPYEPELEQLLIEDGWPME